MLFRWIFSFITRSLLYLAGCKKTKKKNNRACCAGVLTKSYSNIDEVLTELMNSVEKIFLPKAIVLCFRQILRRIVNNIVINATRTISYVKHRFYNTQSRPLQNV